MSQTIPSNRPPDPDCGESGDPGGATSVCLNARPAGPVVPAAGDVRPEELSRLGEYRIVRLLAEGGMGKVYAAEDANLGRTVALKVVHPGLERTQPGATERFLREARAMASIKHDNLVTVYAAGREGDTAYLAMELLHGETLEARLERTGPLPVNEVVRVGRETALGLAAVHDRGLIHRDIKPANLWLEEPTGRVKILDFGLVRTARGEDGLTQIGMIVGTPAYLSPEQVRADEYDHRADLFSLGCVLYRMCTNRIPFPAETPTGQLRAVSIDDARPVAEINPAVPPELAALVMQLLDKDPTRRPATAAEVADRLQRVKRGQTEARRKARGETGKTRRTRVTAVPKRKAAGPGKWVWVAAVAVGLLLAVAVVVALKRGDRPQAGGPKQNDPPPPPGQGAKEFLSTLTPAEAVNWPMRGPLPPGLNGPLRVRGQAVPHGLLMHPAMPHEDQPRVTYRLGGKYRRFTGSVGFNDSAPPEPPPAGFVVLVNGKPKWESRPVDRRDQVQPFDVDVTGADTLTLELRTWGDPRGCHAVWIDPALTK